jgi:glutamyl-tRNA reductase
MERISAADRCIVCGVSYHQTAVGLRERMSIPARLLPGALRYLIGQPGVTEAMVLSTCNRTEIYIAADDWVDARGLFCRMVQFCCGFNAAEGDGQIYVRRGVDAVRHSFCVASSLDSLVLGEPQILGQFKDAFREAENSGCVDRVLYRWIPRVFAAAKQVRTETGICDAAVSISFAAVQLARKIFEDLSGKSVVLLGAGRMGELAALHLKEAGAGSIAVTNRTWARAEEVAARCGGDAVPFEARDHALAAADVIVCSTDAPEYVLGSDQARRLFLPRPDRPLLILDISVPRNVDPALGEWNGVYLFNVDDLESAVEANRQDREAAAGQAKSLIEKAVDSFLKEGQSAHAAPAIAAIRKQVHSICVAELDRLKQRIPALSPKECQELELMLHRIAQKIVHPAIMELKTAEPGPGLSNPGPSPQSFIQKLFGVRLETAGSGR